MSIKEQLIHDIELLPEHTLQALNVIVKEIITLNLTPKKSIRPIFGSGKGQMWISDDFDEPLEELEEYME